MTIDERLERLTERHEALAQILELLTADVREQSHNFSTLGSELKKAEGLIVRMAEGLATLTRIPQRHEQRLDQLEGEA